MSSKLTFRSPVFKHMLADAIFPGSPRFVLVDVKLEAAGVIRTLLLFLRSRPHISQYNDTDSDRDTIVDLIHFARKYEIDVLLHIVTLQLSNVVETRLIVPEIIIWHFRLALALEDTALGALAVIQGRKFQSPSSPFDADGSFRPTLECRQEYLSIPGPMMWIFMELGRAAWGQDCEFDSETMQEHLVVRLEEAGQFSDCLPCQIAHVIR